MIFYIEFSAMPAMDHGDDVNAIDWTSCAILWSTVALTAVMDGGP